MILNGKAIIKANRASIKRSRYLHPDDDFYIVVFDGKWLELEFVSLDCLRSPVLDHFLPRKSFPFVADNRLVRKTGKNSLYIMHIAGVEYLQ